MSTLRNQISADMKSALKNKQTTRLKTLRMLFSACRQQEIDKRIELTDTDIISIIQKMIKQRKDSQNQFTQANRDDLASGEAEEIKVLAEYMPTQMSEAEINTAITTLLANIENPSIADIGKLMPQLKTKLAGKAELGLVNQLLRKQLG